MQTSVAMALIAVSLVGCGAGEDAGTVPEQVGSTEQALTGTWIGPISEESSKSSATCASKGLPGTVALGVQCRGSYCDDMYLLCGPPPNTITLTGEDQGWSPYTSDEQYNNGPWSVCNRLGVVDGIRATGRYSDNVSVHCAGVSFPTPNELHCAWTAPFSEEQGTMYFNTTLFPVRSGGVAFDFKCSGSYCDNLQFMACEPSCFSNADCDTGACNSKGYCVTG
jgi:hypothetical protein